MPRNCKTIVMSNKEAKEQFEKMTKKLEASRKKILDKSAEKMRDQFEKMTKKRKSDIQKINKDYDNLKEKVLLKVCNVAKKEEQVKLMKEFKKIQTDFNKQLKDSAISIKFNAAHLGLSDPLKYKL